MKRPFLLSFLGLTIWLLFFTVVGFSHPAKSQSQTPLKNEYLGSIEYLEDLLQQTEVQKFYLERSWLILGHYKKRFVSSDKYLSEIDGPNFFFAPTGKESPKEELQATLRAFFEPVTWQKEEKDHPQCRFLARRAWILETYKIDSKKLKVLNCEHQKDWINKLNADKISVIFAASYMNNPASMFGHTFLKFHSKNQGENQDLLNYGVNFAASTGSDGGLAFTLKGLLGYYPGHFSMTPYYLKLLDYSNVEGRDIWEYELAFSSEEVERIIYHLLELEQTHFDYYFFSENCSYQLLSLFEWARPELKLQDFFLYHVIPADTINLMAQQKGLISKVKFRPALNHSLEARLQLLDHEEKDIAKEFIQNQNVDTLTKKIESRSKKSQALILDAALAFGAIREFKDPATWREPLFQLQTQRARLGITSERLSLESPYGPPDKAHPPARIALGGGYQKDKLGFIDLNFRFAYHELTDSDVGLLSGSHIQFFFAQARWWNKEEEFELTRARFIDFISLSPWGIYQKPLSWKVSVGYENTFGEDMTLLSGGAGITYSLLDKNKALLSFFADAEGAYQKDYQRDHFFGVGPSLLLQWSLSDHFRILAQARSLWDTQSQDWTAETQVDSSLNWNTHNQIHLRYKSKNDQYTNSNEVMLVWERFLLL